jgi:hypothetical protein
MINCLDLESNNVSPLMGNVNHYSELGRARQRMAFLAGKKKNICSMLAENIIGNIGHFKERAPATWK